MLYLGAGSVSNSDDGACSDTPRETAPTRRRPRGSVLTTFQIPAFTFDTHREISLHEDHRGRREHRARRERRRLCRSVR